MERQKRSSCISLLADAKKGVLTLQILKKNANLLGMEEMKDDRFREMIEAADLKGNRFLDQNEFCDLMLTLSPFLMTGAQMGRKCPHSRT
ncbi:hypothetical protein SUGI_0520920 [Cryptomeria japonica]|nr:hypothetical protein SUGI_0520920 [Cryptomeria japonica]